MDGIIKEIETQTTNNGFKTPSTWVFAEKEKNEKKEKMRKIIAETLLFAMVHASKGPKIYIFHCKT